MGQLTEGEILSKHAQSLKEAKEYCAWLGKQQDPDMAAPRGWRYRQLTKALKELEGTCRQMAHFRADTRWIKLGVVYAKAMRVVQAKYVGQQWAAFGQLTALFDKGLRNMEDLRSRRTGQRGAILPTQPTDWLIIPDWKMPRRLSRVPAGRA